MRCIRTPDVLFFFLSGLNFPSFSNANNWAESHPPPQKKGQAGSAFGSKGTLDSGDTPRGISQQSAHVTTGSQKRAGGYVGVVV